MTTSRHKVADFTKGEKVLYTGGFNQSHQPGVVTSTNKTVVFVDYKRDGYGPGQATDPGDLVRA